MANTLKMPQIKAFLKAMEPKNVESIFKRKIRVANRRIGKRTEKAMLRTIRGKGYERNAWLTQLLKGENDPLVGMGNAKHWSESIKSEMISSSGDEGVFVGILTNDDFFEIARLLHNGWHFKVSKKMRGMFYLLWLAAKGSISASKLSGRAKELWDQMPRSQRAGWKPLKKETTVILMPERPFVDKTIQKSSFKPMVTGLWEKALEQTFKEVKVRSGI